MEWRPLTKQSLFMDDRITSRGIDPKHPGLGNRIIEDLMRELRCTPYPITLVVKAREKLTVTIEYEGVYFGLDSLSQIELPVDYKGGNGKLLLLNNPEVKHEYEEGFNKWAVTYELKEEEVPEIEEVFILETQGVTHPIETEGEWCGRAVRFMIRYPKSDIGNEWFEILSNIFRNVNLIPMKYKLEGKGFVVRVCDSWV